MILILIIYIYISFFWGAGMENSYPLPKAMVSSKAKVE